MSARAGVNAMGFPGWHGKPKPGIAGQDASLNFEKSPAQYGLNLIKKCSIGNIIEDDFPSFAIASLELPIDEAPIETKRTKR